MKIFKKVIAGLLVSATLFSFGACSNKGEVTKISEEDLVNYLETNLKWKDGENFTRIDNLEVQNSRTETNDDGSVTLEYYSVNVDTIVASKEEDRLNNGPIISYHIFDSDKDAEEFFADLIDTQEFYNRDFSDYVYSEGENGYFSFGSFKDSYDAYYYFDNVVIHILVVDNAELKIANNFLKEFGFPLISENS